MIRRTMYFTFRRPWLVGLLIGIGVPCAVLWGLGLTGEVAAMIARLV